MMIIKSLSVLLLSLVIYVIETYLGKHKHRVSSMILILLIYIVVAGNYQNADTRTYEMTYQNKHIYTTFQLLGQWAYYLVISICRRLHLSFIQYRFVVYGIGYIALISAALKVLENQFPFYFLYMLYPMVIDATQMKNFVAMCFVTLGLTMLLDTKNTNRINFIVCIVLAAGFHVVSFVYLPLAVLCDQDAKKRTKYISIIPILLFAILFSNRRMSAVLSGLVLSNLSDSLLARSQVFFMSRVNNGYIIYFVATIALIYIVNRMRKIVINSEMATTFEKRGANVILYCAIFSLVFFPLYFLRQDFSRLLRILFPLFHLLFAMTFSIMNRSSLEVCRNRLIIIVTDERLLLFGSYLLLLAYMFFWDIYGFKESVLIPFFQYNTIFS